MSNVSNDADFNVYVFCAYCGEPMDVKSGSKKYVISHGICPECYKIEVAKIEQDSNNVGFTNNAGKTILVD